MCSVFANFPMLETIRRNAILSKCRFPALLNTFLEQLKATSRLVYISVINVSLALTKQLLYYRRVSDNKALAVV